MITCSIVPNNVCEWMYDKRFVMLLTSALEDTKHCDHYIQTALDYDDGCYKILKNDCDYSLQEIRRAAELLHVDEIVLPGQTVSEILDQIEWFRSTGDLGKYKIQATCAATNEQEFEQNFTRLNNIPEVDVIGLPKDLSIWCKDANRVAALWPYLKAASKEIHLLGFWYSIKELIELPMEYIGKIRSADTTLFALNAIDNQSVLEDRRSVLDLKHKYKELFKENYDRVMKEYYNLLYDKADKEGYLGV